MIVCLLHALCVIFEDFVKHRRRVVNLPWQGYIFWRGDKIFGRVCSLAGRRGVHFGKEINIKSIHISFTWDIV